MSDEKPKKIVDPLPESPFYPPETPLWGQWVLQEMQTILQHQDNIMLELRAARHEKEHRCFFCHRPVAQYPTQQPFQKPVPPSSDTPEAEGWNEHPILLSGWPDPLRVHLCHNCLENQRELELAC